MEYNQIRLGKNIRALRKKMRLNLSELADLTGINSAHLGLIERGQRRIKIEMLCGISSFFNVSIDSLVFSDLNAKAAAFAREGGDEALRAEINELLKDATYERLKLSLSLLKTVFEHEEEASAQAALSESAGKPGGADKGIIYK